MEHQLHPLAIHHLPFFITPPGSPDLLFNGVVFFLVGVVVLVGVLYLHLHSLPERMAHHHSKVQMEVVAVLCLIALFTHQHIFWIIALLLAMIQIPDWSTPFVSIAQSLERISMRQRPMKTVESPPRMVPSVPAANLPPQPAPTMTKAE
ncbi:hypothetical protein PRN20_22300 [Devosia sp. ZB163]|uniref:hypothetical protein n=1 Tax=Devosia sp. ZB163 TaxID=3025938 RepID=UPI0023614731|nr:hypothetical protein [Devosia sp. ZB163]MDC9826478.1 hypothetical protein [Devosia sp. ZB163]